MKYALAICLVCKFAAAQGSPWLQVAPATLPAHYAGGLAAEPAGQRLLQFGGWEGTGVSDATRAWNGASWVVLQPQSSPPPRRDMVLVSDPVRGNVLLFGGDNGFGVPLGDTWTWSGTAWTQHSPALSPAARQACGAWHAATGKVVVFGGGTSPTPPWLGETWEWDGSSWSQAAPSASPTPRVAHGMAADVARNRIVLFGGLDDSSNHLNDTWEWDGSNWTLVHPGGAGAPQGRSAPAVAFDPRRGATVVFGGISGSSVFADSWAWDGQAWTQVQGAQPVARYGAGFAALASPGHLVLAGGRTAFPGGALLGDTWLWATSAEADVFGSGCAGSQGVPNAVPVTAPTLGGTFQVAAQNLPVNSALAVGFFGFSRSSWGFNLLPYELTNQGMPGCYLLVAPPPPGIVFGALASAGQCTWTVAIPFVPVLAGLEIYFQALVPDPLAGNALGGVVTNGVRGKLGA